MFVLFLIAFLASAGFGMIAPVFPFVAESFGAGPVMVTIGMGAFSLGQFLGAPLFGRLSDRLGRKPVLLATQSGAILAYLMMAWAESFTALLVARFVTGFMAGNVSVVLAIVADRTPLEKRAKVMGQIGAGYGVGFIMGPLIGGELSGLDPRQASLTLIGLVSAAVALIALVGTAVQLRESNPQTAETRAAADGRATAWMVLSHPVLLLLAVVAFIMFVSMSTWEVVFALWADRILSIGPQTIGRMFAFSAAIIAAMQGVGVGWLRKRFSDRALMAAGILLYAAGMATLSLSTTLEWALVGQALNAFGLGLFFPTINALASMSAPDHLRGLSLGVVQSAGALGGIAGPGMAGFIFEGVSPAAPFMVGACAALTACLLLVFGHRRR
jgi:DHA1 family tetracycline resistance protein-like MFS transporter